MKKLFLFLLFLPSLFVQTDKSLEKTDYKDEFLRFILLKAEKYSNKGEEALDKVVEKTQETLTKAIDIAAEEAPILLKEYVMWKTWEHGLKFFAPFIAFWILAICAKKKITEYCKEYGEYVWPDGAYIFSVCLIAPTIVSLIFTCMGVSDLFNFFKVVVAPRVYILEEVAKLIQR